MLRVDLYGPDGSLPGPQTRLRVARGGYHEQGGALVAAQHAGEGPLGDLDGVGDLSTLDDPDHLGSNGVSEPDPPGCIEAASVRHAAGNLRPDPPIREGAVGGNSERAVPTAERLTDY